MQDGGVPETYADIEDLVKDFVDFVFKTNTTLNYGIEQFVEWYEEYH